MPSPPGRRRLESHWPTATPSQIAYLVDWVVAQMRWQFTVDDAERQALTAAMAGCPNAPVKVTFAR
ncbi:hypothetical protein [Streptomyces sp. NPDC054995]